MRIKHLLLVAFAVALAFAAGACSSDDSDDATDGDSTETTAPDGESRDTDPTGGDDGGEPASLPDGWPEGVELPADTTLISATEGIGTSMTAVARIDGEGDATFEAMKTQLTDAGYEIVASTFTPSDQGGFGSISASGGDYTVAVSFGPDPTGDTSQVTISVAAAA